MKINFILNKFQLINELKYFNSIIIRFVRMGFGTLVSNFVKMRSVLVPVAIYIGKKVIRLSLNTAFPCIFKNYNHKNPDTGIVTPYTFNSFKELDLQQSLGKLLYKSNI